MKIFNRKLWILAFVATWVVAPGFPSLVCAMTLPSEEHSALAEMTPDCHRAAATTAAGQSARPHRGCCEDAKTSCCLRALDVHGAVGSVLTLDSTAATAVVAELPTPASPSPSRIVPIADARDHSPPGNLFRVLRL